MRSNNCYVLINLEDYSIRVCTARTQVADIIGCNRSTLKVISERTTRNNYLIVPTPIERVKRSKR